MAARKPAKRKSEAVKEVPQSETEAAVMLGRIGSLRRAIEATKARHDEQVKEIGEDFHTELEPLRAELEAKEKGLQTYAEANRSRLTRDGKVKYFDFGTGRITWRHRPPKVNIRGAEDVIKRLKALGLHRFIRIKEDIDRDAMLNEPDVAREVTGVGIGSESEDFAIEPAQLKPVS